MDVNQKTLKEAQKYINSAIARIRTEVELTGLGYRIPDETLRAMENHFLNAHRLIDIAQGIQPKRIEKLRKIKPN